jgi:hypothetical protein
MATPKTMITPTELEELAWIYIQECINNKKEHPTASGKIVLISDKIIPTINYFLKIWIPNHGQPTIARSTFYSWLKSDNTNKSDKIIEIEGLFEALAVQIIANSNKGVFYAKNKLGMDKIEQKNDERFTPIELVVKYSDDIKPI